MKKILIIAIIFSTLIYLYHEYELKNARTYIKEAVFLKKYLFGANIIDKSEYFRPIYERKPSEKHLLKLVNRFKKITKKFN